MATTTAQSIQSYYQNILFRTGTVSEVQFWTNLVDNGGYALGTVENSFAMSAEAAAYVAPIVQMYQADLGRAPDAAGLAAWVTLAESGMSLAAIDAGIQGSAEGKAYAGTTVDTAFVTKLYQNILGRAPETGAAAAWVNSGLTAAQIEDAIRQSPEGQKNLGTPTTNFLLASGNGTTITGSLLSVSGGIPGTTFTLTTGIDNLTGTPYNDTFTGTIAGANSTINAGDTLNGAGGSNTLQVVQSAATGGNGLAGVNLTNIQTVSVQNAFSGAGTYDFSAASSVSKAVALNTSAGGTDAFNNLATGAQVVASGSGTAIGTAVTLGMKTGTDAVSVGVDGGVSGVTFTVTAGAPTAAMISSTGAANGTVTNPDVFALGNGGATLTSLTVNAATNLIGTLTTTDYKATGAALTVSGAASGVNLVNGAGANFKTIDASNLAGGLTIALGTNLTSFTGGSGNDVVTTAAALGATTASEVNAGGGTANVLNLNAAGDVATATLAKQYAGFQVLKDTVAGTVDVSLLSNSAIGSEQIGAAGNPAIILSNLTAAQAAAITVIGNVMPTLNWTGTNTPASTVGFTVNDNATAASVVTITAPTVTGTNSASTVNLNVANSNDTATVTSLTGLPNLSTLTVTGTGSANITTGGLTVNPTTVVDASALAGKFTFDASATANRGMAIKGGVGANTITLSANAGTSGTTVDLTANAKGGSTVTFSATGSTSPGPADTITLGTHSGADTISTADAGAEYGGTAGTLGAVETINNFTVGSTASTSDVLKFLGGTPAALSAGATTSYTAAQTGIANLTASATNGILTFGGSGAGAATLAQLIAAAGNLDNTAANTIDAFVSGSNTYVVESPSAGAALATDHVFALNGMTGLTGINNAAAANTLLVA